MNNHQSVRILPLAEIAGKTTTDYTRRFLLWLENWPIGAPIF